MNFAHEIHIGTANAECSCCGTQFSDSERPHGLVRFQPIKGFNFFVEYSVCKACTKAASRSAKAVLRLKRRVAAYHLGEAADDSSN